MADYEPSFYNDNWTVLQKIVYLSNWCKVNTVDINSITFTYTDPDTTGKYTVTIAGKNYKGDTVTLGTVPAYKGTKGDKGDTGATGATGEQGEKGDQGAQGVGIASIASETPYISGENMITPLKVTLTDNTQQEFTVIARNGVDGAAGKDGTNFYIVGNLNTAAELPANPPRGESAYLVGETTPRDLYVYDYTTNAWVNEGALQGVKGDTGETGADGVGIESIVAVSHSTVGDETVTNLQVNYTEGKAPQTVEVHAQNGAQGVQGADGEDYLVSLGLLQCFDPPQKGNVVTTTLGMFNRIPKLNEVLWSPLYYPQKQIYYLCSLTVIGVEVPSEVVDLEITNKTWETFIEIKEKLYNHNMKISNPSGDLVYCSIVTKEKEPYTAESLLTYINSMPDPQGGINITSGYRYVSSTNDYAPYFGGKIFQNGDIRVNAQSSINILFATLMGSGVGVPIVADDVSEA